MPFTFTYAQFLDWAKANNQPPRPIGYFENEPPQRPPTIAQETPEQAARRIIREIGPEDFDKLPDAPAAS